jgi:phosphoribosylformylglycinamidine synthase
MPFKAAGDLIYVVGLTKDELGASALYRMWAEQQGTPLNYGGEVPKVDGEAALNIYRAMNAATDDGLLRSATTPTKGGLAVSLALATVGGQLGAQVDLTDLPVDGELNAMQRLFSESNSRFLLTVAPENAAALEALFADLSIARIGEVSEEKTLAVKDALEIPIDTLVKPFKQTLHGV